MKSTAAGYLDHQVALIGHILSLQEKSAEDCEQLIAALDSCPITEDFFGKLGQLSLSDKMQVKGFLTQMCEIMYHEKYEAGDIIIKQGTKNNLLCYCILEGTVKFR